MAYPELVSGGFPKLANLSGWWRLVSVLYQPPDLNKSLVEGGGGVSGQPKNLPGYANVYGGFQLSNSVGYVTYILLY